MLPTCPLIRPLEQNAGLVLAAPGAALRELAMARSGRLLLCAHTGTSMNPTLHRWDLLELVPCDGDRLRAGDVILFVPPTGDQAVVHRIIEVRSDGLRTRGDSNPAADSWLLRPADVIGQVVAAQRGTRRRAVTGGRRGLLAAWLLRRRRALERRFSHLLYPIYDGLARCGIVQRLLPPSLRPTVVAFQVGEERLLRLLWRRQIIGHLDAKAGQWRIRRPFRLLVDERRLPPRS